MKRLLVFACVVLLLHSCKPEKPWSPDDDPSLSPDGGSGTGTDTIAPVKVDIGDAEQGVFIVGTIDESSKTSTVAVEEIKNRRDRMAIVNVSVAAPVPEQLWANYTLQCFRDFPDTPVVLRAKVMVEGKAVGSISAVIGKGAQRREFSTKVDLLSQFDQVPQTFLATVEGELLLMPEGTDEASVVPETATSSLVSRALLFNPMRVNIVDTLPPPPAPDATAPVVLPPAPTPADPSATPPAAPAPEASTPPADAAAPVPPADAPAADAAPANEALPAAPAPETAPAETPAPPQ